MRIIESKLMRTIILLVVFISIGACKHDINADLQERESKYCIEESFKDKISFVSPKLQKIAQEIHLNGTVETDQNKKVNFISLMEGIISETYFELGDKVSKGQVLAEMKSAELNSLNAESETLSAQIRVAERHLQSVKSMFEDGISSQKELLQAESELQSLKSEKGKISATLSLYNASNKKGTWLLKSPLSGIITSKTISAGTQVIEGESLFSVADLSQVWVMINIYTTNIRNIKEGMEVKIQTMSYPDLEIKGEINSISYILDEESKVLKARVILPNTDFILKPGMQVDVTANKIEDAEALAIPTESIVFDDDQSFVVVYKNDCDLLVKKIEILATNGETTYISKGLDVDDKIISQNQLLVYEQIIK